MWSYRSRWSDSRAWQIALAPMLAAAFVAIIPSGAALAGDSTGSIEGRARDLGRASRAERPHPRAHHSLTGGGAAWSASVRPSGTDSTAAGQRRSAGSARAVTQRVSVSSSGSQSWSDSFLEGISANGRYVAFWSETFYLVPGDTNSVTDVFVRDRRAGVTSRVSVSSDGGQGNGESRDASISADGRYVAFSSWAKNLVPGDTNEIGSTEVHEPIEGQDVFVRDRKRGETSRINVASNGRQANRNSHRPAVSADGRYVAFTSTADNLVAGDTNRKADVFVHDRLQRRTTRVSVSSNGRQGNRVSGDVNEPGVGVKGFFSFSSVAISGDGRFVAFASDADNLAPGDMNRQADVFVRDLRKRVTTRISLANNGREGNRGGGDPAISSDGRYVAFLSAAGNLVRGDTNHTADVFVRDLWRQRTTRISVASDGRQGNRGHSGDPAISADGRYVAFVSSAANLVQRDTNFEDDVFLHDRLKRLTSRVSVSTSGRQGELGGSLRTEISADGRQVAFQSNARNLVRGDTNQMQDVFVRDRLGTR